MKKEYSNDFYMIPIDNLPETISSPYSEFDRLHSDLDITLDIEPEDSDGNTYYSVSAEMSFEDVDESVLSKYGQHSAVAILFKDITNNTIAQLGTDTFPARVYWSEKKGANTLSVKGFLLELT